MNEKTEIFNESTYLKSTNWNISRIGSSHTWWEDWHEYDSVNKNIRFSIRRERDEVNSTDGRIRGTYDNVSVIKFPTKTENNKPNDSPPSDIKNLIESYAPILYFHEDEEYFPEPIEAKLDYSELKDDGGTVIIDDPSISDLNNYDSNNYYLDLEDGALKTVSSFYSTFKDFYDNTIYARSYTSGGQTVIQYWFFYIFNDGINNHEGDWEMIEILFDSNNKPLKAGYSQHYTGRQVYWENIEKEGNHPIVYVAKGSHASYFDNGINGLQELSWEGCKELNPIPETGLDRTDDHYKWEYKSDYSITILSSESWLEWDGHWGRRGLLESTTGPQGPKFRHCSCDIIMWNEPITWIDHLPFDDVEGKKSDDGDDDPGGNICSMTIMIVIIFSFSVGIIFKKKKY